LAGKVKNSYAVASQLPAPISVKAHTAFVSGMHTALLIATATVLVAAAGAVVIPRRGRRWSPAPDDFSLPVDGKPGREEVAA
jgi:hypothetical protein